jgi:hypothetical protein
MSLIIEARMLFKIKTVRRDLRKFAGPIRFFIMLNLKKLLDCGCERGAASVQCKECYVQSPNVIENK